MNEVGSLCQRHRRVPMDPAVGARSQVPTTAIDLTPNSSELHIVPSSSLHAQNCSAALLAVERRGDEEGRARNINEISHDRKIRFHPERNNGLVCAQASTPIAKG